MKIAEQKTFTPLIITLDSQEEIDQLFSILNNKYIADAIECDINGFGELYKVLKRHQSQGYEKWHNRITTELIRTYGGTQTKNL